MKKTIILGLLFFVFIQVSFAQDTLSACVYSDSIFSLNINEKQIDIKKYNPEIMTGYDSIIIDNESYKSSYHKTASSILFEKNNKKLGIVKYLYYSFDGKIESMSIYYKSTENSGVEIGFGYNFNSDGTIKEKINYDNGYKICWNEVIPIVKKIIGEHNIKKYEITDFGVTRINLNESPDSKPKWKIYVSGNGLYTKKNKGANGVIYIIDGINGKLINKRTYKVVD